MMFPAQPYDPKWLVVVGMMAGRIRVSANLARSLYEIASSNRVSDRIASVLLLPL
jgi:hypothetical protein